VYLEVRWFVRAALSANLNLDVSISLNVLLSLVFAVLMERVITFQDHSIVSVIMDILATDAKPHMYLNALKTLNVTVVLFVMAMNVVSVENV
jgi:hypothetical protein